MSENAVSIGRPWVELSSVDSTNNYAMACCAGEAAVAEGTTYFAHRQTAGRGQRGRRWSAEAGENITLSVVLRPESKALPEPFLLNAAMALGTLDFFRQAAGEKACIKWSNDLYWDDRKAGGLLIENSWRGGRWQYAVVGIGININQVVFPTDLPNPVSLRQITGQAAPVVPLARELCRCLDRRYQQLRPGHYERVMSDYTRSLYRLDQPALYEVENETFEGIIRGVAPDGRLLLERGNTRLQLDFGAVRFVI
ncbi:biotin--[acetyl-CoA-carboxylase] ligase [Compostibacter hankyongensis]|uniref:biotin--[biotin carboxyl-carrier protein] ligase n=1 Tax=Compostibacter hankyongensis TaxID=1007089 RepID=A0ABP8FSU6_9BACT